MPRSYNYPTADGESTYPAPPYTPSIGLMQSPHTNLKTALGLFPPNNVEVKSRYYSSREIAKVAPEYLETSEIRGIAARGVSLEETNPGVLRRMGKTVAGLAAIGGISLLMIFTGMV